MDKAYVRRTAFSIARLVLICTVLFFAAKPAMLFVFQQQVIFHPSPYPGGRTVEASFPRPLVELPYDVGGAGQVAFYSPRADGSALPVYIWILFGGNGSHALDYGRLAAQPGLLNDGFLFVDYPGYGLNAGRPSPDTIRQGSLAALQALAAHLNTTVEALNPHLGIVGHSMGTGAATILAEADPRIGRVVLAAPYTSLCGMARLMLGYGVCFLVRHNIDNEAALNVLAARDPRPRVAIVHGTQDEIIPVTMSRRMAAEHPGWIDYRELPGQNHGGIVFDDPSEVAKAMEEMEGR
jgi:pimeloyl-ACP methyl ester carboxylesterase